MIDISEVAKGKEDDYLRHLADLTSCPCYQCVKNCVDTESCEAYVLWQDAKWAERKRHGRSYRNPKKNQK